MANRKKAEQTAALTETISALRDGHVDKFVMCLYESLEVPRQADFSPHQTTNFHKALAATIVSALEYRAGLNQRHTLSAQILSGLFGGHGFDAIGRHIAPAMLEKTAAGLKDDPTKGFGAQKLLLEMAAGIAKTGTTPQKAAFAAGFAQQDEEVRNTVFVHAEENSDRATLRLLQEGQTTPVARTIGNPKATPA